MYLSIVLLLSCSKVKRQSPRETYCLQLIRTWAHSSFCSFAVWKFRQKFEPIIVLWSHMPVWCDIKLVSLILEQVEYCQDNSTPTSKRFLLFKEQKSSKQNASSFLLIPKTCFSPKIGGLQRKSPNCRQNHLCTGCYFPMVKSISCLFCQKAGPQNKVIRAINFKLPSVFSQ